MAKNQTPDEPEVHYEEVTESPRRFDIREFIKTRNFKIIASVVGGVVALGATFGIGVAAGQAINHNGVSFGQGGFGPGPDQGFGPSDSQGNNPDTNHRQNQNGQQPGSNQNANPNQPKFNGSSEGDPDHKYGDKDSLLKRMKQKWQAPTGAPTPPTNN